METANCFIEQFANVIIIRNIRGCQGKEYP